MSLRVYLTRRAEGDLDDLDPPVRDRVVSVLRRFSDTGHGDIKKLKGEKDRWRLRVGDWRVLFTYASEHDALLVLRVLPRGKAYR